MAGDDPHGRRTRRVSASQISMADSYPFRNAIFRYSGNTTRTAQRTCQKHDIYYAICSAFGCISVRRGSSTRQGFRRCIMALSLRGLQLIRSAPRMILATRSDGDRDALARRYSKRSNRLARDVSSTVLEYQ